MSALVASEGGLDPELFATRLGNRKLTSTRSGIRKAEAAQRYARVLVDHGLETLDDVGALLGDVERTRAVERALASVPGHGSVSESPTCGCSPATTLT